jgi:hypothetical protein
MNIGYNTPKQVAYTLRGLILRHVFAKAKPEAIHKYIGLQQDCFANARKEDVAQNHTAQSIHSVRNVSVARNRLLPIFISFYFFV